MHKRERVNDARVRGLATGFIVLGGARKRERPAEAGLLVLTTGQPDATCEATRPRGQHPERGA
jgi:hypothetical protein